MAEPQNNAAGNNGQLHSLQNRLVVGGQPDIIDVYRQLEHIEQSTQFRNSAKLKRFLRFVVEEKLQGREAELNVSKVARNVFGKNTDFSNSDDSVVRVNANRLRRALDLHNATEGNSSDVVIKLKPGSYVPAISYRKSVPANKIKIRASKLCKKYQYMATAEALLAARSAVAEVLYINPEDADMLACYASLISDAAGHGFEELQGHFDEAEQALEKARSVAETNSYSLAFCDGVMGLYTGDIARATDNGRVILRSEFTEKFLTDGEILSEGAWLLALSSDFSSDEDILCMNIASLADFPGWIHHPRFLSYYQHGDYEAALSAAIAFAMPNFFWGCLERAAALAQLGLLKSAHNELLRTIELNPKFKNQPKKYLNYFILHQDTMEHVFEGLQKAGFDKF